MAGGDEILVDEEARGIVSGLESFNAGNPSPSSAESVDGPASTPMSAYYRAKTREFAVSAQASVAQLVEYIRLDAQNAVAAIDDFHRQDQEIMEMLKRLESETAVDSTTTATGILGSDSRRNTSTQPGPDASWAEK